MKCSPVLFAIAMGCAGAASVTDSEVQTTDTQPEDTGAVAPSHALVNGDAEACALDGWTLSPDGGIDAVMSQDQGTSAPTIEPAEGSCFFSFAAGAVPEGQTEHSITQTGATAPGAVLRLSGQYQTRDFEFGTASLTFRDADGNALPGADVRPENSLSWIPFEVETTVPDGAVLWEVGLTATVESGSTTNTYFDDVVLDEVAQ